MSEENINGNGQKNEIIKYLYLIPITLTQSAQKLQEFRSKAYQLLGRAKDATFDLMDAVLVTRNIYSFA